MIEVFGKWPMDDLEVKEAGLKNYITLEPTIVPRTGARYAGKSFHKSKVFIVERLINKIMCPGHKSKKHFKTSYHITGKGNNAYKIVFEAFKIIEQKAKENPIKVFVKALENAAPREEVIAIEYGGARYPKAVECAPQRRVDLTLRLFTQSAYQKAFSSKKSIEVALADEILAAFNQQPISAAIAKKNELERQADASR